MRSFKLVALTILLIPVPCFAEDANAVMQRLSDRYQNISRGKSIIQQRADMNRRLELRNERARFDTEYKKNIANINDGYNRQIEAIYDPYIEYYENRLRRPHMLRRGELYREAIDHLNESKKAYLKR